MDTALSYLREVMDLPENGAGSDRSHISRDGAELLSDKVTEENAAISAGIRAIGGLMAAASADDDFCLNFQELGDIGGLLRFLGKMQVSLSDLGKELSESLDIAQNRNESVVSGLREVK